MYPIHFTEKGKGRPLVLIHGFCETSRIWDRFAEDLAPSCRVLMPDLPGFGKSALLPTPFSIDDVGVALLNWLDELQVREPVVIGHSLGGYVTMAMAEKMPDRFPGFGLFHSTALADSEEKKENRNKTIAFVERNGVQPFIDTFVPGLFCQKSNAFIPLVFEIASQTSQPTLLAYAAAMRDRPSRLDLVEKYPKPILMIAGEQDSIIGYEASVAQSTRMRFPYFNGLAGVAHMGLFENEPATLKIVKDFLNFVSAFTC